MYVQNSRTKVAEEVGLSELAQRSQGGRQTHRRGRRMDAQGSVIGRPVKMRIVDKIVNQFERRFCFRCTGIVPPLADQ